MQTVQNLDVLRYVPRVVNGTNGIFTQYRVSVKANEGDPWQEVSSGTWENNTEHKLAVFNSTVAARYAGRLANSFAGAGQDFWFRSGNLSWI